MYYAECVRIDFCVSTILHVEMKADMQKQHHPLQIIRKKTDDTHKFVTIPNFLSKLSLQQPSSTEEM